MAVLLAAAPRAAGEEAFALFPEAEDPSAVFGGGDARFALGLAFPGLPAEVTDSAGSSPEAPPAPAVRPQKRKAALITTGVLIGATISTLTGGWGHGFQSLHVTRENWFGQGTYAGGADKASHFVLFDTLSRELAAGYRRMGYGENRSYAMAFATSVAAGLIIELGDGSTVYGFSWEDLITDAIGAGAAVWITKHGLDDVVGFRFGPIPAPDPNPCCAFVRVGKDYSKEIYTGDLKIAGVANRLGWRLGPARFLYLSATYGSKGYKLSTPEFRQRDVGFELGLNVVEILKATGVKDTTWWGRTLLVFFDFFRIPYTSIGYRYDLNHRRWHGPDNGEKYDPGP